MSWQQVCLAFLLLVCLSGCANATKVDQHQVTVVTPPAPVEVQPSKPEQPPQLSEEQPGRPAYGLPQAVPVLMYHSIADEDNQLCVSPAQLAQQLDWLQAQSYTTLTLKQLLEAIYLNQPLPAKPIVLSFDDGYLDNYTAAFPLLKERGMVATIFVIGKKINTPRGLTAEQITAMQAAGIEFGSHTVNHPDLRLVKGERLTKELQSSKELIETIIGEPVVSFCYPAGKYTDEVIAGLPQLGYYGAVTTEPGQVTETSSIYQLPRIRINRADSLTGFAQKVQGQP